MSGNAKKTTKQSMQSGRTKLVKSKEDSALAAVAASPPVGMNSARRLEEFFDEHVSNKSGGRILAANYFRLDQEIVTPDQTVRSSGTKISFNMPRKVVAAVLLLIAAFAYYLLTS